MAAKLTPRQAAFVNEYLVDLNAAAAARRAGYSERTARKIGQENLTKPDIAKAIEAAKAERSERTLITADRVLSEIAKLAFANLMDYFSLTADGVPYIDLTNLTPDQTAALTEITVDEYVIGGEDDGRSVRKIKIKMADKRANLELLAKHLGLFNDKPDGGDANDSLKAFVDALTA